MVPHLHSSSTTPAKSSHYIQAVSGALLSGSWGDNTPVKAPNGAGLDWAEGIRKWGKHTGGDTKYLHLLRNVLLSSYSSRPRPNTLTHSPLPPPSSSSNPSTTNPQTVPPSSASDQSRETSHSFVSVPSGSEGSNGSNGSGGSGGSAVTSGTSGSSYVHVGATPTLVPSQRLPAVGDEGREELADVILGPVLPVHPGAIRPDEGLRGDQESSSTITGTPLTPGFGESRSEERMERATSLTASTSRGAPVTGLPAQQPRTTTTTSNSNNSAATVTPAHNTLNNPQFATVDVLSRESLDGDETEEEILSLDGRWVNKVSVTGEVRRDFEAVRSSQGKSGVLARAYLLLEAYYQYALGDYEGAIRTFERVDWAGQLDTTGEEMGVSLMAQRADWERGKVVFGICLEMVGKHEAALDSYIAGIRMFADIPGITLPLSDTFLVSTPASLKPDTQGAKVLPSPAHSTGTRSTATFGSHREAHRWASLALTRATVISARTTELERTARLARTYHFVSRMWPCSFRPSQQGFMLDLYLRTLFSTRSMEAPISEWLVCEIPNSISSSVRGSSGELWLREWTAAMAEGRRLLAETTTFPRAGEVNWRVARFVESCVQMWERAGYGQYHAKEVIKILWWAIEMTFHSQSVLRHLARLLHATGQHQDARRVFEIYVKLVLKARQTARPDVVLQLKSNKLDDELTAAEAVAKEAKETDEKPMEGAEIQMDSDIDFIKTLVFGARLFTREIENPSEAWRYAVLAGDVISLNSSSFDKDVHARVEQCKGTVRMAMAYYDGDVSTRPILQAQGVAHLIAASKLSPSNPLTKYHLAYAQAEAREIAAALDTVREAIELLPTNVEAWHLLALMLTATKDWTGALKATSAGISTWEANERDLAIQQPITESGIIAADPVGVSSRDFAPDATNDTESLQVAVPTPIIVGQSVSPNPVLTTSVPLIPAVVTARLAVVIQLRMTQAVIVEKLDGVEGAMITQQDTFAYFSSRSGYARPGEPDTAGSADGGSVRDLGESFFSVNETAPAGVPPIAESMLLGAGRADSNDRSLSRASTYNAPAGRSTSPTPSETEVETKSISGKRARFLSRHLHVPGNKKNAHRPPVPALGKSHGSPENANLSSRPRAVSNNASMLSRGTTPAHSHYHGARPAPPPLPPVDLPSAPPSGRNAAETRLLANLWLQSAATFRRSGKNEQALGAIQEAEVMDPLNPEVWVQLGRYHELLGDINTALQATGKALVLSQDYPPAVVHMSELYLKKEQADLAHGLLNPLTQARGWDIAEAWYYLAKVCEAQGGRLERSHECLLFALKLEKGRACRPLHEVIHRWL